MAERANGDPGPACVVVRSDARAVPQHGLRPRVCCVAARMRSSRPSPYGSLMTTLADRDLVLELSTAHVAARAVHVIADLGVADVLGETPQRADRLAAAVGADPDALERLLRLLETHGLFGRDGFGQWRHTDASAYLRGDHPASLLAYARMSGTPFNWGSVTHLGHAARTGQPGITQLDPDGWCSYLDSHPDEDEIFQEAMTAKAHADIAATLSAYDFSGHRQVADVGGGHGHFIKAAPHRARGGPWPPL